MWHVKFKEQETKFGMVRSFYMTGGKYGAVIFK